MAMEMTQTADLTQAMQTLKWLDEERRKDKATIAALQERVQGQGEQLAQQADQIQQLQIVLASVQGTLSRATEFEQMASNYKTELVLEVDQREETRRKEHAEAERLRRMEYEALTDDLNRLEKDMRALTRYAEELNATRAENQRLSEALQGLEVTVADLNKRSDDRVQAVTYLEEQRRADNRRIADLELDTTELHKRIEFLTTKFSLLEDTLQKQRTRIEEAVQETKKLEKPIEELRISDFQREQKMKQYVDQGEQVAQEMERIRVQTQEFLVQQQLVRRALQKLEGFQARLEKRQNEVAEMQRLAEDRLKRQWEEWQDRQDKRQKKREVIIEERWRAQERTNAGHGKRLEMLQSAAELHRAQLDALWEARRADAFDVLQAAQDEYEARASQADAQLTALRDEQSRNKGR
jgi:chromosome segregation ATPase